MPSSLPMSLGRCWPCRSCWRPSCAFALLGVCTNRFTPSIITNIVWMTDFLGLRMASFHGNFFVRSTDLLAMPAVPQDQSYAIEVQIEETITSSFVVFQTAVLHTTCYGVFCRRRYRLLFLTVTFQANAVFGSSRSHSPQRKIFQSCTRRQTRWRLRRSWRTRRLSGR